MAKAICQHALDRVMLYLHSHGISPTPAESRRALALIDECLAATSAVGGSPGPCETDLARVMARVMARLPDTFDLPASTVCVQHPPIQRGSIGYGP